MSIIISLLLSLFILLLTSCSCVSLKGRRHVRRGRRRRQLLPPSVFLTVLPFRASSISSVPSSSLTPDADNNSSKVFTRTTMTFSAFLFRHVLDSLRVRNWLAPITELHAKLSSLTSSSSSIPSPPMLSRLDGALVRLIESTRHKVFVEGAQHVDQVPRLLSVGVDSLFTSRYEREFEQLKFIAKGGFGVVYSARNRLDNFVYAIKKIVIDDFVHKTLEIERILREVSTLAKLNHPNVVNYKTAWIEHSPKNKQSTASLAADLSSTSSSMSSSVISYEKYDIATPSSSGILFLEEDEGAHISEIIDDDDIDSQDTNNDRSVRQHLAVVSGKACTPPSMALASDLFLRDRVLKGHSNRLGIQDLSLVSNPKKTGKKKNEKRMEGEGSNEQALLKLNQLSLNTLYSSEMDAMKSLSTVLFVQMQLCESTLRSWLDRQDREVVRSVNWNIFRQILLGVNHVHEAGIVHRDLKPRNIFVSKDLKVQIGDFGLARESLSNSSTPPSLISRACSSSLHTSGVGTEAYAAPEQLELGPIDLKSDVYSLGVILLELFCIFNTRMERSITLAKVGQQELPPTFEQEYRDVAEIVLKMTQRESSKRPSVSSLLEHYFSENEVFAAEIRELKLLLSKKDEELNVALSLNKQKEVEIKRLNAMCNVLKGHGKRRQPKQKKVLLKMT